jgi:hypothetical protein
MIASWDGVSQAQADAAVRSYGEDESFAGLLYSKKNRTLSVYHNIILGRDGISMKNMLDNIEYFDKEFEGVGKIMQGVN